MTTGPPLELRRGAATPATRTHAPPRVRRPLWIGLALFRGTSALPFSLAAYRVSHFAGNVRATRSVQAAVPGILLPPMYALSALGLPPLTGSPTHDHQPRHPDGRGRTGDRDRGPAHDRGVARLERPTRRTLGTLQVTTTEGGLLRRLRGCGPQQRRGREAAGRTLPRLPRSRSDGPASPRSRAQG
jgi:hypothetical protein